MPWSMQKDCVHHHLPPVLSYLLVHHFWNAGFRSVSDVRISVSCDRYATAARSRREAGPASSHLLIKSCLNTVSAVSFLWTRNLLPNRSLLVVSCGCRRSLLPVQAPQYPAAYSRQ